MKSIIGGREEEEGGGGAVGVEEEWRRQLRSGNQTGIGQRMEYWRGDGKIGQGPVWGGGAYEGQVEEVKANVLSAVWYLFYASEDWPKTLHSNLRK